MNLHVYLAMVNFPQHSKNFRSTGQCREHQATEAILAFALDCRACTFRCWPHMSCSYAAAGCAQQKITDRQNVGKDVDLSGRHGSEHWYGFGVLQGIQHLHGAVQAPSGSFCMGISIMCKEL